MKKSALVLVAVALAAGTWEVVAQTCRKLKDCGYVIGGGLACVALPGSQTTYIPTGEPDPTQYYPASGSCGYVTYFGVPTGASCGGPPVGGHC